MQMVEVRGSDRLHVLVVVVWLLNAWDNKMKFRDDDDNDDVLGGGPRTSLSLLVLPACIELLISYSWRH